MSNKPDEQYKSHLQGCTLCKVSLCPEGRRLWEANDQRPAYIRQSEIGTDSPVDVESFVRDLKAVVDAAIKWRMSVHASLPESRRLAKFVDEYIDVYGPNVNAAATSTSGISLKNLCVQTKTR